MGLGKRMLVYSLSWGYLSLGKNYSKFLIELGFFSKGLKWN